MPPDHVTSPPARALFERVVGPRAFEEIVDQISLAVMTGKLDVGDRLPTIDELAKAFGVSPPTVGNAVRVLAEAEVVSVKRGATGGITVTSAVVPTRLIGIASRRRARSLADWLEARRAVEPELAALAARRARESDLIVLKLAIEQMQESAADLDAWSVGNFKFHHFIGVASQSQLLAAFLSDLFKEYPPLIQGWTPRDRTDPHSTLDEHLQILSALRSRDPDSARAAMERHLRELEEMANGHG